MAEQAVEAQVGARALSDVVKSGDVLKFVYNGRTVEVTAKENSTAAGILSAYYIRILQEGKTVREGELNDFLYEVDLNPGEVD